MDWGIFWFFLPLLYSGCFACAMLFVFWWTRWKYVWIQGTAYFFANIGMWCLIEDVCNHIFELIKLHGCWRANEWIFMRFCCVHLETIMHTESVLIQLNYVLHTTVRLCCFYKIFKKIFLKLILKDCGTILPLGVNFSPRISSFLDFSCFANVSETAPPPWGAQ